MTLKKLKPLAERAARPLIPRVLPTSSLPDTPLDMSPEDAAKADTVAMFKGLRKQQADANEMANSVAFYRGIYFQTPEQAEQFEKHFGLITGGTFWDGEELAARLGVDLTPRTTKYKTGVLDKKCAALAR